MSESLIKPGRLEVIHLHARSREKRPQVDVSDLELIGRDRNMAIYGAESLVEELDTVRKLGGLAVGSVYHATSSVALPAIAKHEALLSSKSLLEKSEPVVTGEITTDVGEFHRHFGGLEDVYASNSTSNISYSQITGEDEYPVIFGISTMRSSEPSSYRAEECRLGPRVELDRITAQIVLHDKVPEMRAWSQVASTESDVTMSLDAAFVLGQLGNRER